MKKILKAKKITEIVEQKIAAFAFTIYNNCNPLKIVSNYFSIIQIGNFTTEQKDAVWTPSAQ